MKKSAKRKLVRRGDDLVDEEARYHFGTKGPERKFDKSTTRELIEETRAGDWEAANALVAKRSREARSAVHDLFEKNAPVNIATVHVASTYGGASARAWLHAALLTFGAQASCEECHVCISAAAGLLALETDADDAAMTLVSYFDHEEPVIRQIAVGRAAVALEGNFARSIAKLRLEEALAPLAQGEDAKLFAAAFRGLCTFEASAFDRAKHWLASAPSADVRTEIANRLVGCRSLFLALPMLLAWIQKEPSLRARLEVAWILGSVLPKRWLATQLARGLADPSPSLRVQALTLADQVAPERARALLTAAIEEEPDAYVRKEMRNALRAVKRKFA